MSSWLGVRVSKDSDISHEFLTTKNERETKKERAQLI